MTKSRKFSCAAWTVILATCVTGMASAWAAPFGAPHPMRAIEVGAAALIVAFGGLLLAGYLESERLWMFTG